MGRCRCCLLVAASLLTTAAAAAFGWFYVWQVLYAPYLQGARDIVYDAARERVIISALHSNVIAVVDVATPSKPRTLGWRADDAFTNAHGFAYDHGSATAYVRVVRPRVPRQGRPPEPGARQAARRRDPRERRALQRDARVLRRGAEPRLRDGGRQPQLECI